MGRALNNLAALLKITSWPAKWSHFSAALANDYKNSLHHPSVALELDNLARHFELEGDRIGAISLFWSGQKIDGVAIVQEIMGSMTGGNSECAVPFETAQPAMKMSSVFKSKCPSRGKHPQRAVS